jgi:membrane protease YdiL (CAAX protease family)
MTGFDHVMAVLLVAGLPAYAAWELPRLARRIAAGETGARRREYWWTCAIQWALTAALLWQWSDGVRWFSDLGLAWPQGGALIATLLVSIAVIAFFAVQVRTVAHSEEARASVRRQFEGQSSLEALLPRTRGEARLFYLVSLTAGTCEEVLYRGFLFWYLARFVDTLSAAAIASVVFGVAHAYQGPKGMLRTGLAGAVAMTLYLLTGSLVASMVLHTTVDAASGWMAQRVLS